MERASLEDYLRDQYATTEKLDIRLQAHQRYSERPDDFLDWVLDRLAPQPGQSVIDIGCGKGAYHLLLARRGVRPILGIDASLGMVTATLRQASEHKLPVLAVQARAEHLPAADGSYDLAMANYVLFHVSDVIGALREVRRVLKPGGRAVLSTPGVQSAARLEALHRQAAARLGYHPAPRVNARFNMDHLDLVAGVFPNVERFMREDAFVFPSADVVLRYYASGMIDALVDRPADRSHRPALLEVVGEGVRSIIDREGIFRDPKPAGCFVVRNV